MKIFSDELQKVLLQSTSDCLLKLVQAAVFQDAEAIAITISRYGFGVQAKGASGPSPRDLEEAGAEALLDDPLSLAAFSLVHAGAEVVYERATEGGLQRLTLPSHSLEVETSHKKTPGWAFGVTFKRSFLNSLVEGLKNRADWHRAVHRCRFSPVPITLGRRDIIDPYPDRATRPFFQMPIGACLVSKNFSLYERYEAHDGPTRHGFRCIPGATRQAFRRIPEVPEAPTLNSGSGAYKNPSLQGAVLYHETVGKSASLFRRALRIPVNLEGDSQLTIIHGGVALQSEAFRSHCPGVEIVESLGALKTDQSGLKLIRDEAFDRHIDRLDKLIGEGVDKINSSLPLLPKFASKYSDECHLRRHIEERLKV